MWPRQSNTWSSFSLKVPKPKAQAAWSPLWTTETVTKSLLKTREVWLLAYVTPLVVGWCSGGQSGRKWRQFIDCVKDHLVRTLLFICRAEDSLLRSLTRSLARCCRHTAKIVGVRSPPILSHYLQQYVPSCIARPTSGKICKCIIIYKYYFIWYHLLTQSVLSNLIT